MKFVHIAGTNGKGSVAEYISNIISAGGASCGCYTSPHLVSPTERMRINCVCITEEMLNSLLKEVDKYNLAINETQFAKYTAAAFLWFERMNIDYAVIETGLGGRLDPTNVIDADIVVLTPIGFDHTQILGASLEEITAEKCGIIKNSVNVISAKQPVEATIYIENHCAKHNASLLFADDPHVTSVSLSGQTFSYQDSEYEIASIGEYQPQNAVLAIMCAKALGLPERTIRRGLQKTVIKARTQYVDGTPLMIVDGAHNPSSITMLLKTLNRHFKESKKVLLFACMDDKDYPAMIDLMSGFFTHAIVVNVDIARGANVHELHKLFSKHTSCQIENDIASAVAKAKQVAINHNALLVICGSLYLAGSKFIQ